MKLVYKILWFEDDEDIITIYQGPAIKSYLTELGFTPIIDHRTNAEDLDQLMTSFQINSYDLILSDYNLDDTDGIEIRGNDIIKRLRDGSILTEVLLYSSQPRFVEDVINRQGWVERASFCAGRPNLEQKLKDIITLTVRKQQDVNNTRGLVIAETIILEHKISDILLSYFDATTDVGLGQDKLTILGDIKKQKIEHGEAQIEILNQLVDVDLNLLIDKGILTANNILEALISVLKQRKASIGNMLNTSGLSSEQRSNLTRQLGVIKSLKAEMNAFKTEIIDIRNTLAHVVESVGDDGVPFLESRIRKAPPVRFDSERYVQIRKDLQKHNKNLDDIKNHLAEE